MFTHNFIYSLKVLLKNKMLIFWTFAFPILLGIFFNMAFSDIEKNEKLDIINIAIIDSESSDNVFKETFKKFNDETQMFNINYTNLEDAKKLLENKKITGYIIPNDNVNITVSSNGVNETILKYVVDEINSNKEISKDLSKIEIDNQIKEGNYNIDYQKIYKNINNSFSSNTVKLNNISNKNLSYTMIEYYTLIAMTCLYGGIISMFITNYKLANMNSIGKRTSISPIHKGKMLLGSLLASYIIQLLGITLLFIFTIFVLKVDYGNNLLLVVLLAICGSLAGLSLGVMVATTIKSNENTKTGILIAITMLGCFLSGMMGITMKYIVDKNIPIINKINPVSMITDGFYSLYYYDTLDRFFFNIISLLLFSIIMFIISYNGLRRQKYDNI